MASDHSVVLREITPRWTAIEKYEQGSSDLSIDCYDTYSPIISHTKDFRPSE